MYEIVSDPGPTGDPVRLRLPALLAACAPTADEEKAYRDFGLRTRALIDEEPLPGSCITDWSAYADKLRNIGSSFSERLQRDLLRPKTRVLKVKRKEEVSASSPPDRDLLRPKTGVLKVKRKEEASASSPPDRDLLHIRPKTRVLKVVRVLKVIKKEEASASSGHPLDCHSMITDKEP